MSEVTKEQKAIDALEGIKAKVDEVDTVKAQVADLEGIVAEMKSKVEVTQAERDKKPAGYGLVKMIRAIHKGNAEAIKAASEGVDSEGGYFVLSDEIWDIITMIEDYSDLRAHVNVFPTMTNSVNMYSLTTDVGIDWIDENNSINHKQAAFGTHALAIKKMAAYAAFSNELLNDQVPASNIAGYVVSRFAAAIAREEDDQMWGGTGSPFTGVATAAGVSEYYLGGGSTSGATSFANVTADDLLAATLSVLHKERRQGAAFVCHPYILSLLRQLKAATTGQYLVYEPTSGEPASIWGYPIIQADALPALADDAVDTPFMFFGNLKNIHLADRAQMTIDSSTEAGDAFLKYQTYVRVIQREGILVSPKAGGLVRILTAAS